MAHLRHRSRAPELMDGEDITQQDFAACVEDLARVNTLTLARPPTLAFIDRALGATTGNRILTIVDVGFGAGDMLRAVARQIERKGRKARLIGFDINPRSEPVARRLTPQSMGIDFRTGDVFAMDEDEPIDLVISSLVTHHMEDTAILRFLGWMEQRARLGWFVNDLHRHWFAYHGFRLLADAMRWHPFVRHDGPLSIARSFRRNEWEGMLDAASLSGLARVRWRFPFRYCVERTKW